jgi:hypothetical protein
VGFIYSIYYIQIQNNVTSLAARFQLANIWPWITHNNFSGYTSPRNAKNWVTSASSQLAFISTDTQLKEKEVVLYILLTWHGTTHNMDRARQLRQYPDSLLTGSNINCASDTLSRLYIRPILSRKIL